MTRRIVLVLVATVLVTLVAAGAVTVGLAHWQARASVEGRLREQAESVAGTAVVVTDGTGGRQQAAARRILRQLRRALRVDGIEFVLIGPAGGFNGQLPDGVTEADLDAAALRSGQTVSGAHGDLVWAAAPQAVAGSTAVAVITASARTELSTAARWFLVAAITTLVIGTAIALWLGRRLARPVRDASVAAHRIAGGDLATRLPVTDGPSSDELEELSRSINAMAAGLERARTLDQQFLLSISHDLRTPLTSIRGYAEAIGDGTTADPAGAAAVIASEADRLDRLVADLLTLARLDGRAFGLHPVAHDLTIPVGDAVRAFLPTATSAGLSVGLRPAGVPASVVADPERVQQVLGNLLANAAKFARHRIEVTIDGEHGAWVVRVDDDGVGIPPDERHHVFERLYSARTPPVRAEVGSGLGLAIVTQLVDAMGGTVRADESPLGGARLEVRLPAALAATPR
ncbi:MAG: HAMP domain-containing sensor histidine kinase [Ilumatobacteraceae bacterium]